MAPKAPPSRGAAAASGKARALKYIPRTTDLSRGHEGSRLKAKAKARSILKEVHGIVKAAENLPGAVQVERYAETRALEIAAMQNAVRIAASQSNSRAFQSLPRHLRRRAASHNPRRVPKKVRGKAAAEIDAGDRTVQIHRKMAKLRAKGNLRGQSRTEQLRARQVNRRWLGSHIFHSKRFHMVNLWGYRLASTPTLKSFRSAYRAARRKATLHDASYFGTIGLEGSRAAIIKALSKVTSGGAFAGKKYEGGAQVANVDFYEHENVPHGLIGPAQVIWKPSSASDSTEPRTVWLRVHPSIFDAVYQAVRASAGLGEGAAGSSRDASVLTIRDLRDKLEAFEVIGPLAGKVLRRVLRVVATESPEKKEAFRALLAVDPAEIPSDVVVGVTVHDPRLSHPPSRLSEEQALGRFTPSSAAASSSLWEQEPNTPRFKKSDLDARREKLGIPGTRLQPLAQDDRIPIMIIKRAVQSRAPQHEAAAFHGYTLLIPHGWSMAFLPSFIHCNVRLGGLIERRNQYREAGVPSFPEHYGAVCPAGTQWEAEQARAAETRWLRKPPGKRPEYSTLGTKWPFKPDWSALTKVEDTKPWLFNSILASHLKLISREDPASHLLAAINEFRKNRALPALDAESGDKLLRTGLCHVEVESIGRGSPSDMAMLSFITGEERREWLEAFESDARGGDDFDPIRPSESAMLRLGQTPPPADSDIVGFVSVGNISLTRGNGHGLATITLDAYLKLLQVAEAACDHDRVICKVRNRDGLVSRLVSLVLVQ